MIDKNTLEMIEYCNRNLRFEDVHPILIGPIMLGHVRLSQKSLKEARPGKPTGLKAKFIARDLRLEIEIKIGEAME